MSVTGVLLQNCPSIVGLQYQLEAGLHFLFLHPLDQSCNFLWKLVMWSENYLKSILCISVGHCWSFSFSPHSSTNGYHLKCLRVAGLPAGDVETGGHTSFLPDICHVWQGWCSNKEFAGPREGISYLLWRHYIADELFAIKTSLLEH